VVSSPAIVAAAACPDLAVGGSLTCRPVSSVA
jgi:hypothetical protein